MPAAWPHPPFALDAPAIDEPESMLRGQGRALLAPAALAGLAGVPPQAWQALAPCWDDLPADAHLLDGGHYRFRRHGSFELDLAASPRLADVPHRAHWQGTEYNALHGGLLRWFEPLQPALAQSPAFRTLVAAVGERFARVREPAGRRWYVEAHAFRIDTRRGVGRPTPEGAHRDGVDFVAVVLVARTGVRGGETRVFDADGPHGLRFTLHQPWSALLLDDTRVIHETTPIVADDAAHPGWRDTLVLTYRSGGFQDPPASPAP